MLTPAASDVKRHASALAAPTDGGTPLSALAVAPSRSVQCPRNSDGFAGLRATSAVAVGSPCRPVAVSLSLSSVPVAPVAVSLSLSEIAVAPCGRVA